MGSTQAMSAWVVVVTGPTVVHHSSAKARPNPNLFQGFLSAFAMPGVQSQPSCGIDMHPMQQPFDTDARFISVLQGASDEQRFEALDRRSERFGGLRNPIDQRPLGKLALTEIAKGFTGPFHRHQLKLREIHCQRLHTRTILGWGIDSCRKASSCEMPPSLTAHFFIFLLLPLQAPFFTIIDL